MAMPGQKPGTKTPVAAAPMAPRRTPGLYKTSLLPGASV
jgi:hypothetical protein